MRFYKKPHGNSILEVILALALLLVAISGAMILAFRSLETLRRSEDMTDVSLIAQESFEAFQEIAYTSWGSWTDNAIYGLTSASGQWKLQTTPDLRNNTYTRSLTILPVYRDANCLIAKTGTNDPDTKNARVTITWNDVGTTRSQEFTKLFTNWKQGTKLCTLTEAGSLEIYVDEAELDRTKKEIHEIEFRNTGKKAITITHLIVSWIKESHGNLVSVRIEDDDVWHEQDGVPTGTKIDIDDVTILPGKEAEVNRFRFDSKLDGSIFTITAIMKDDSQISVTSKEFPP